MEDKILVVRSGCGRNRAVGGRPWRRIRGVPVSRPEYNGPTKTTFGTAVIDGRERHMRDLVWAAMSGLRMEDNPIRPGEAEMMVVWAEYARNVRVQEPTSRKPRGWSGARGARSLLCSGRSRSTPQASGTTGERRLPRRAKSASRRRLGSRRQSNKAAARPYTAALRLPHRGSQNPGARLDHPYLLLKRAVTMLVAPPGHGKSLLTYSLASRWLWA